METFTATVPPTDSTILECGHVPTFPRSKFTTGYGVDAKTGARSCFACCADMDRAYMIEHGRILLYFTDAKSTNDAKVNNWPGTLVFKPTSVHRSKRYGFGVPYPREDFHFNGPDGFVWHGFRQGNNTQIAHCRRTKRKVQP